MEQKQQVLVVGHKNPDTDSICSAIAYADLKNKIENENILYIPRRAGNLNEETRFVLDYFRVPQPELLEDVNTQIQDIQIQAVPGVSKEISLKMAWDIMKREQVETLPVVSQEGQLEGVITLGEIARSYMDYSDSMDRKKVRTKYKNILATTQAVMHCGNPHSYFSGGKVVVALDESFGGVKLAEADLVVAGADVKLQMHILKQNVGGLLVCQKELVADEVLRLAEKNNCQLMQTSQDVYMVVKLLGQSMPIHHFMNKTDLVTFWLEDTIDSIRDTMAKRRRRDFPVLDGEGHYCGMLSRRNLLNLKRKQIILVDHNERTQAVEGIEDAHILEVVDHHRLGNLETIEPLYFRNQPVGCTCTIIYDVYKENHIQPEAAVAGLMCSAILSDTLLFRSPTCTQKDIQAGKELARLAGIDPITFGEQMFREGSDLAGKDGKEIFYQDFKTFVVGRVHFGVGQISSMNAQELEEIKVMLLPQMEVEFQEKKLDMLFFMLTNIRMESTELLCMGERVSTVIRDSFQISLQGRSCRLEGLVSRKKQLIPALLAALQE